MCSFTVNYSWKYFENCSMILYECFLCCFTLNALLNKHNLRNEIYLQMMISKLPERTNLTEILKSKLLNRNSLHCRGEFFNLIAKISEFNLIKISRKNSL